MLILPHALRSLLWPALDTISAFVVGLGAMLWIARIIGPNAFGLGALALSIVLIAQVIIVILVHDALINQAHLSQEDLDSAFTLSVIAGIGATALTALAAPLIGAGLGYSSLHPVLWGFSPLLLLNGISSPLIAERRRALQFGVVGRHQIVGRFMGAIAGVCAAFAGAGVWSYVTLHSVSAVYVTTAMVVTAPRIPAIQFSWRRVAPMIRYSRPIILSQFLSQALARLFVIAIGYWHGLAAAGHWGIAARFSESLINGTVQATYHVTLAHFSRLQHSPEKLVVALQKARALAMIAAVPFLAALAAASVPLVQLLLGPGWERSAHLLLAILFGSFLYLRRFMPNTALLAMGLTSITAQATLANLVLGATALWLWGSTAPMSIAVIAGASEAPAYLLISYIAAREFSMLLRSEIFCAMRDLAIGISATILGLSAGALLNEDRIISQVSVRGGVAFAAALALTAYFSRDILHTTFSRRVSEATRES